MNTIYDIVKQGLIDHSWGRERHDKNRFVAWMLYQKWDLSNVSLNLTILESMITDVVSYTRLWQKVLAENVELRGSDYDTKAVVEQAKKIELGYEPGFHENSAKLGTL